MRLFKISQNIVFQKDSACGLFKEGQEILLSGHLMKDYDTEIVMGYLKQEQPVGRNDLTLYLKGYWVDSTADGELFLMATTKDCDNFSPVTLCNYFPDSKADGYVDETFGTTSKEGHYFFICGNYLATSNIKMEEMSVLTEFYAPDSEYARAEKKLNQMINRLYVAKKQSELYNGNLFDCIQPHGGGALWRRLIHIYPNT